ncbi:MAG: hypothetical protein AAB250_05095 [Bdellovibrionota bacterium]
MTSLSARVLALALIVGFSQAQAQVKSILLMLLLSPGAFAAPSTSACTRIEQPYCTRREYKAPTANYVWETVSETEDRSILTTISSDGIKKQIAEITSSDSNEISAIAVDADGRIFLSGFAFEGELTINGKTIKMPYDYTTFVVRLSKAGQLEKSFVFETISQYQTGLAVSERNVYFASNVADLRAETFGVTLFKLTHGLRKISKTMIEAESLEVGSVELLDKSVRVALDCNSVNGDPCRYFEIAK